MMKTVVLIALLTSSDLLTSTNAYHYALTGLDMIPPVGDQIGSAFSTDEIFACMWQCDVVRSCFNLCNT